MASTTKIATCCYCGTRAALVLAGRQRHELSCSACGAPLHDLKRLRADAVAAAPARRGAGDAGRRPAKRLKPGKPKARPKTGRRRGGMMAKLLDEAWDMVEDVFD